MSGLARTSLKPFFGGQNMRTRTSDGLHRRIDINIENQPDQSVHAPEWWTLASPENHGVDIAAWPDFESYGEEE